jgi:preprotein translocase subunit SecG
MAFTPRGESDGAGGNGSSRLWIVVIGCVIVVALAVAMLMHSGPATNRQSLPGSGSQSQQR